MNIEKIINKVSKMNEKELSKVEKLCKRMIKKNEKEEQDAKKK